MANCVRGGNHYKRHRFAVQQDRSVQCEACDKRVTITVLKLDTNAMLRALIRNAKPKERKK